MRGDICAEDNTNLRWVLPNRLEALQVFFAACSPYINTPRQLPNVDIYIFPSAPPSIDRLDTCNVLYVNRDGFLCDCCRRCGQAVCECTSERLPIRSSTRSGDISRWTLGWTDDIDQLRRPWRSFLFAGGGDPGRGPLFLHRQTCLVLAQPSPNSIGSA